ncbi:MAG TPA: hypothetical protein PK685_03020 [archaeon]|jgi:hypothetical protein|nr:hypothetical protein [archaeon]
MIDFKKALTSFYSGIKWYYIVFILAIACLSLINDTMAIVSLMLTLIFGISIFGLKLTDKLKTPKKTVVPILKNSGMLLLISIIFLIAQYVLMIIGMIPFLLIAKDPSMLVNPSDFEVLLYSTPGWQLIIAAIVLLIFVMGAIILELFKIFGMTRYFKTEKFVEIFDIKDNLKQIFTKDYLTIIIFLFGIIFISIIKISIIFFLLTLILNETISGLITSAFLIIIALIVIIIHYSLVYDKLYNKK